MDNSQHKLINPFIARIPFAQQETQQSQTLSPQFRARQIRRLYSFLGYNARIDPNRNKRIREKPRHR